MTYSAQLSQANDRAGLISMASLFSLMTMVVVAFRFYSRRLTGAGFARDDWLALAALVLVLGLNGIFIGGTVQGAITGHSPVVPATVDNWPVTTELEHLAQKYKYAFQTTEKITFGLIKLSILFLWKRIFGPARPFVLLCWIMIGVITAWCISFFFATVFQCGIQWTWNWAPIGIFLTQCTNTLNMLTVFTATDLFTDFIIMFMPVPLIWKLQMPTRKKVGITSIFMVGLFTIGAGIARMYIYLVTSYDKEDNLDFIANFTLFILWSEIEANVAMVVCCMPTLAPVIGKVNNSIGSLLDSSHPGRWTLLSSGRAAAKISELDLEMSMVSNPKLPLSENCEHNKVTPWQGGPGVITEARHGNIEEKFAHNEGAGIGGW
ncbi:hypothetical protein F4677DRAFT_452129 [Hypoxylon crocopeplum]|nr:hypothetical protein F4677DRAFT_452129 [Hypoxylon crocopeplum]